MLLRLSRHGSRLLPYDESRFGQDFSTRNLYMQKDAPHAPRSSHTIRIVWHNHLWGNYGYPTKLHNESCIEESLGIGIKLRAFDVLYNQAMSLFGSAGNQDTR